MYGLLFFNLKRIIFSAKHVSTFECPIVHVLAENVLTWIIARSFFRIRVIDSLTPHCFCHSSKQFKAIAGERTQFIQIWLIKGIFLNSLAPSSYLGFIFKDVMCFCFNAGFIMIKGINLNLSISPSKMHRDFCLATIHLMSDSSPPGS